MEHTEGNFTSQKGFKLFHQCWLPDSDPTAMLLVAHGLAEHSGRYGNLVDHFVPRGYAVCGLDYRGHGRSEGQRCHIDSFSEYSDDLRLFFDIVRREHINARIFLVGHSMGATIAAAHAVRYQDELTGLILSGITLEAGSSVSAGMKLAARILSVVVPKMGVSVIDASTISRDQAVVDAYVNDPLVYRGKIRARLGAELLKTIDELHSQVAEITLPILIMHGTADRLSDPEGSRLLYERVGSPDKTLKLYEGYYHEIFNEPDHGQVMADVEAWLAARI
jgi:alpha-beta hydrolase superfamily lysophospholipase